MMPLTASEKRSRWSWGLPKNVRMPPGNIPYIIAVGGGKGGVGKSLLSANVAAKLAAAGNQVLLVDLDIGGANLHTHFGMSAPDRSLADFMVRGSRVFSELPISTAIPGLSLVAGGREDDWGQKLQSGSMVFVGLWNSLLRARMDQGYQYVILDLGAGTHSYTIDFFTIAHAGVVVVLPEPTSIENSYVFLKSALWRFIENVGHRSGTGALASEIRNALSNTDPRVGTRSYAERLRNLSSVHPLFIKNIFATLSERNVGIVVNQARSQQDTDIGSSMELICQKYFGYHARFLGALNYDESVWRSIRSRKLLVEECPDSQLSQRFSEVTQKIIATSHF
jgi:flagellar biosynthesis protein FlhG